MLKSRFVSNLIGVGAALCFLVFFVLGQIQFRAKLGRELEHVTKALGATEEVVVAKIAVNPGTALTNEFVNHNFEIKSFFSKDLPEGKIITSLEALKGREVVETLYPNEPVLENRLSGSNTFISLRNYLAPGRVAFALPISPERAVGGQIDAKDRIDIIAATNEQTVEVILRDVLVLGRAADFQAQGRLATQAIGSDTLGFATSAISGNLPASSSISNNSLILDLAPQEAVTLAKALARGSVYVALKSPNGGGN